MPEVGRIQFTERIVLVRTLSGLPGTRRPATAPSDGPPSVRPARHGLYPPSRRSSATRAKKWRHTIAPFQEDADTTPEQAVRQVRVGGIVLVVMGCALLYAVLTAQGPAEFIGV